MFASCISSDVSTTILAQHVNINEDSYKPSEGNSYVATKNEC